MPGYKIHDAVGNLTKMENLAYRKGLNAPDYFKKIKSKEDFDSYFEGCDKQDILSYVEFLEIVQNTHFGYSSNPDIKEFLSLEFVDLGKDFWEGYLIHLITDKEIYKPENECIDWSKFQEEGSKKEILHNDWDITNQIVNNEFHIPILPEIEKLGLVKYLDGTSRYVHPERVLDVIYKIRKIASNSDRLNAYLKDL